jgi:hypothetical protein
MTHVALKDRIRRYLLKSHGWAPKGVICDLARERVGATGEHTGRRLRELENEGVLEVEYRKGHAWYRAKVDPVKAQLAWFDALPYPNAGAPCTLHQNAPFVNSSDALTLKKFNVGRNACQ